MYQTEVKSDEQGFTLVEVLVVITLLSIVSSVAVMGVPGLHDRITVGRVGDQISTELSRVSLVAFRTGYDQLVSIVRSEEGSTLRSANGAIEIDASITLNWVAAGEAGSGADEGQIAFFGSGGSSGGKIELLRGQTRAVIDVDWLTSRVRRTQ